MRSPSNSPITMPFGSTDPPYTKANPHKGVDFAWRPDNKIYAPFAGKVTQVRNNGNDGNGTYMTDSQGRQHGLLHASEYLVANNSNVQEGQPIAVMGQSGYADGVHLHWAVKENGKFINGLTLIKGDDMFEGRTAADWAAQAKDAQKYKDQVVASLSWKKIDGQIGGGMGEQIGNIRPVIDSLEVFKDKTINSPAPNFVTIGTINGKTVYEKSN